MPTDAECFQYLVCQHLAANDNRIANPIFRGVSREADENLDPRPTARAVLACQAIV